MLFKLDPDYKVVGAKQVKKALKTQKVETVFVATDAEAVVIDDIVNLCNEKQVKVVQVKTMKELGNACGIDVNAATAALLNNI